MNKLHKKKRVYHIIMGLVLILLISTGGLVYGLLYQGILPEFNANSAIAVVSRVNLAEKTGETVKLKSEDLNGILKLYLKKKSSQGPLTIKSVNSQMQNDKLSFYIPAKYKNFNFLIYCEGSISYDDSKIFFKPSTFKIGKINIDVDFALNKLKSYSSRINVSDKTIELPKDILPFNLTALSISGNTMLVKVKTVPTNDTGKAASQTPSIPVKKEIPKRIDKDILIRVSNQLGAVYSSVATQKEKQVISTIQTVVSKMIESPAYAYGADAKSVKVMYSTLTTTEKNGLKTSLLTNMDTDTLLYIKNTFGL